MALVRARLNTTFIAQVQGKAFSHLLACEAKSPATAPLKSNYQKLPGVSLESVIKASVSPGNMRCAHVRAALMCAIEALQLMTYL